MTIARAIGMSAVMLLAAPQAHANGPSASIVPGDVIVKFREASEAGALVARAMRAGSEPGPAAAIAERLSAELGIALAAVRVTSGRELVLSIDRERIFVALEQSARRDAAVRHVMRVSPPDTVLASPQLTIVVDFQPGSEPAGLLRRAGEKRVSADELQALVARLARGVKPLPTGTPKESGRLALTVDVVALTRDLVGRLKLRADVDYAQPSYVLKPLGGDTGR